MIINNVQTLRTVLQFRNIFRTEQDSELGIMIVDRKAPGSQERQMYISNAISYVFFK